MKKPTKAVIAAAGIGSRFLPQTKAMPKEMLPIVDKPVIQIVVEQLVAAGVTEIIIVTGSTKRAIEDHFDRSESLENELLENGKEDLANEVKAIAEMANFVYIRQKGIPKGNARPLLNAAHLINDEPFFMVFADEFYSGTVPAPVQLLEAYEKTGKCVVALDEIDPQETSKYGIAKLSDQIEEGIYNIESLVEKPKPEDAPSRFAANGGYLLTPDIIEYVAREKVSSAGDIVLAESINDLAQNGMVCGKVIDGKYQDAGDKFRYLKAVFEQALVDPRIGAKFKAYIEQRIKPEQ